MGIDRKGYSPANLKSIWKVLFNYFDKLFHECKVIQNKNIKRDESGYDLSQHAIITKTNSPYARVKLIASYLMMFIYNLVPGTKRVKYKEIDYLMIPVKDLFIMAGKFSDKAFRNIGNQYGKNWIEYVNKKYWPKPKKTKVGYGEIPITKQDLVYMYYDKKLTQPQIAKIIGVGHSKMDRIFKHYDLPARDHRYMYISPTKLADLYYEQDFTIEEISRILDASQNTILVKMKQYNIPRRDKRYTTPIDMARAKVFKSQLRKQLRLNPIYSKYVIEVMDHFDRDPDLKPETAKIEKRDN